MPRDGRRAIQATILEAAAECFASAGLAGARMQDIADKAGIPKSNLHYYYGTKNALYEAVLEQILDHWLTAFDHIRPDADPADAISAYIRQKMADTRQKPVSSRVFANEILSGGKAVEAYLTGHLRDLAQEKASVIERWIADGRMAPVDPLHLFFCLWSNTQTYADFEPQVRAVLGREKLEEADYRAAEDHIVTMTLRGCGVYREPEGAQ